jgi:hypothetical protein
MSQSVDEILSRYRPYGPVFKPGEKAPVSGTYVCHRGTMLPPVRLQLTKGEEFPEAEGLGAHTRWKGTNIQG